MHLSVVVWQISAAVSPCQQQVDDALHLQILELVWWCYRKVQNKTQLSAWVADCLLPVVKQADSSDFLTLVFINVISICFCIVATLIIFSSP